MEAFSSFNCLAKDTYQPKKYLTDAKLFYLTSTNLCEESRKFIGSVSSNSDPLSFLSCGKWRSHDWTWKQSCTMNSTLLRRTFIREHLCANFDQKNMLRLFTINTKFWTWTHQSMNWRVLLKYQTQSSESCWFDYFPVELSTIQRREENGRVVSGDKSCNCIWTHQFLPQVIFSYCVPTFYMML